MKSTGSPSAGLNLAVHVGPSASLIPASSPLESPSAKAKTREVLMPITRGLRSSITRLSTCHCSSPQSSAWRPATPAPPVIGLVLRTASKTPPCEVPPRAIRSTPLSGPRSKKT